MGDFEGLFGLFGIMFGLIGQIAEAAANPNGGAFQIRLVDTKAARG